MRARYSYVCVRGNAARWKEKSYGDEAEVLGQRYLNAGTGACVYIEMPHVSDKWII